MAAMDRQIDVAGAESLPEPPAARGARDPRWALLGAGIAGGLIGAAAVFLLTIGGTPAETEIATADTSLAAPAVVRAKPGTVQPPPSLAERVPGLTSDLVAFGYTPSGQAVIQQWFINGTEPRTIDVPFGFAIPDLSGRWIAALANQRYGDSLNLHVGNATYQEAIATDVGSVVWSVDEPGRIAWTERTGDGVIAFDRTMDPGDDDRTFALPVPSDTRIVWLDGDRLTLTSGASLIAFQPDGMEVARLDDAEFVAATDGWAVVRIDEVLTLVDEDLVPRAPLRLDGASCGDVRFARKDPTRRTPVLRLAAVCGATETPSLEVLDIDPTTSTFTSLAVIPLAVPGAVSWLDGDRFVAVPQPDPVSRPRSTITILDVETGEVTDLQWPGAVLGVIGTR
jgi:hypothetical protein